MKAQKFITILKVFILSLLFTSCVKDDDFELPDTQIKIPPFSGEIKSLAEVSTKASEKVSEFNDDYAVEGYVISSDEGGNYYEKIYIQTLDGTDGFSVAVKKSGLFGEYPVGTKVQVRLKGLTTQILNGKLEVGYETYTNKKGVVSVGKMPVSAYKKQLINLNEKADEATLTKKVKDIKKFDISKHVNLLVTFERVFFEKEAVGQTYHQKKNDKIYGTNYGLLDSLGGSIVFRTSKFAKFANETVPSEKLNVTGIITKYRDSYQFMVRTVKDVQPIEGTNGQDGGDDKPFDGKVIILEEVAAKANDKVQDYTSNDALEGYVVSSDQGGNYYQKLYIQTTDKKGAFAVPIASKNLYKEFPVGTKVQVRMKGLTFQKSNGIVEIGKGTYKNKAGAIFVGKIPEAVYKQFVVDKKESAQEKTLIKTIENLENLNFDENLGMLIELKKFVFEDEAKGKKYHEKENDKYFGTNYKLFDSTKKKYVTFRTGKFAKFKNSTVPSKFVTVVGLLTKYKKTYQFSVRTEDDIKVLDIDDNNTGGDDVEKTIPYTEDFSSATLPEGWKNLKVKGDRTWQRKEFNKTAYMQMSAYSKDGTLDVETWLVSPKLNLSGANNSKLQIYLADAFSNGIPLTIKYSTDYNGDANPTTSNWKEIGTDAVKKLINNKGQYDNKYEKSDAIAIPETGKVFIALIYNSKGTIKTTVQLEKFVVSTNLDSNDNGGDNGNDNGGDDNGDDANAEGINTGDNSVSGASDLFFSEYVEGSSSNKYLEIFNGTGAEVNLSKYAIKVATNGKKFSNPKVKAIALSGKLPNGATFVIQNDRATLSLPSGKTATKKYSKTTWFNGDDAVGLFKDSKLIDVFGTEGEDPGKGWTIDGTKNATVDHTLVRVSSVKSPNTTWTTNEWTIKDKDDVSNLGSHSMK